MPRGVPLSTLRSLLKAELRDAQAVNSAVDTEYNYALANKQQDLCANYDWSFLEDRWDLAVGAGARYVTLPASNIRAISAIINFQRPVGVDVYFQTFYRPLEYGIGAPEYNVRNSDLGETQDQIQRWTMETNTGDASNPDQVEVWPIPSTPQTIRFTGQREPRALAVDADKCDLDSLLLVFFVAADYLAMREQANAALVLRKAQDFLIKLRGGYPRNSQRLIFGRNLVTQQQPVKLIAVT